MTKMIALLTVCAMLACPAATCFAAEPPKPKFTTEGAGVVLSLGQDNKVYVSCGNMIVQCQRDGSQMVGLPAINSSVAGVAASSQGLIGVAYAHFTKNVTLFDRDFHVVNRFTIIADAGFRSPAGVATGPSGDFYALDQGLDRVIRFHSDGIRCGIYGIPREPAGDKGELAHFRICEKTNTIYVVNRARWSAATASTPRAGSLPARSSGKRRPRAASTPAAACSGAMAGSTWTRTAFSTCWRRPPARSSATTPAASRWRMSNWPSPTT